MSPRKPILFPPYELDPINRRLLRDGRPIALRQKALAVLECLAARAGTLVTKEELFQAVWPGTTVAESLLAGCIRELRQALGDQARKPRFIETAHGLGYRFIAPVRGEASVAGDRAAATRSRDALVGREAELGRLRACFARALGGERQVVFVSGQAGIGKTALVEAFVASIGAAPAASPACLIGRGQCIDQRGVPESFLPIFDALADLCRAPEGAEVLAALRAYVPACLPFVGGLAEGGAVVEPVGPERMARLLVEVLEAQSARRPLLLVLEDLQWGDEASLILLSCLARRGGAARLMVVATYRPIDVIARGHPLQALQQELRLQRCCIALALGMLDARAVSEWLARRIGEADALQRLAAWLHQRTDGSPLFLVNVFEHLTAHGWVTHVAGRWEVRAGFETVGVPESLRLMIEGYLDLLEPPERELLEAASVVGMESTAAAIAACVERDVVAVEEACDAFLRRSHLLGGAATVEWPDGTASAGYRFLHGLYQEVAYDRLGAAYRAQLHRRIGERLELAFGSRTSEVAATLAVHFERGRDAHRAAIYHHQAGVERMGRSAFREAADHLSSALASLATLPVSSETRHRELITRTVFSATLASMKGYAAADVGRELSRTRQLATELGEQDLFGYALIGLWSFHNARAEYRIAISLARDVIRHGEEIGRRSFLLWGQMSLVHSLAWLGELAEAHACFERGAALYDPQRHGTQIGPATQDPKALGQRPAAWVLWALGHLDDARIVAEDVLAVARERRHAYAIVQALYSLAVQYIFRHEIVRVRDLSDELILLSTEHHHPFFRIRGGILRAWVDAVEAPGSEPTSALQSGYAAFTATGAAQGTSFVLGLLAEAHLRANELSEALATLDDGLRFVAEHDERFFAAELHRLRGDVLARQGAPRAAEQSFLQGLEVARAQGARSWELRLAIDLARLWMEQGKVSDALALLTPIHAWFSEGFDTHDLASAGVLIAELSRTPAASWNASS